MTFVEDFEDPNLETFDPKDHYTQLYEYVVGGDSAWEVLFNRYTDKGDVQALHELHAARERLATNIFQSEELEANIQKRRYMLWEHPAVAADEDPYPTLWNHVVEQQWVEAYALLEKVDYPPFPLQRIRTTIRELQISESSLNKIMDDRQDLYDRIRRIEFTLGMYLDGSVMREIRILRLSKHTTALLASGCPGSDADHCTTPGYAIWKVLEPKGVSRVPEGMSFWSCHCGEHTDFQTELPQRDLYGHWHLQNPYRRFLRLIGHVFDLFANDTRPTWPRRTAIPDVVLELYYPDYQIRQHLEELAVDGPSRANWETLRHYHTVVTHCMKLAKEVRSSKNRVSSSQETMNAGPSTTLSDNS